MGLIFFCFFEKFFVPILTSGGLAAVTSSFFAALYSAFGKYDVVHIHAEGPAFFSWLPKMFGKRVVVTIHGIDWQREKWQSGLGSKFIHQGEKNAVKYADEVIVLSKGVQDYFKETYGRKTHFIPNGVNRPQTREANLITDKFGLKKDSYILFLGRLVPEKGIRYLVEAFKNVKTDKKLVIAGGSSDTDSFMKELKELAKGDDRILFTGFVQGAMLDELYSNAYIYTLPSDLEGMSQNCCYDCLCYYCDNFKARSFGVFFAFNSSVEFSKVSSFFRKLFLLVLVTSMILFRTLLNRDLWMNPLSDVMGGWGIWETVNGERQLTTECIENVILMMPFTGMVMWTFDVEKSKIRLCIRNRSCGRFPHGGILMGIVLPIPSHRAKSHDFAHWWPATAGHSRSVDALPGKSNH